MTTKQYIIMGVAAVALAIVVMVFTGLVGVNDGQNWTYLQPISGQAKIINSSGMYYKGFGKTWVYPRFMAFLYNDDPVDGDKTKESTGVTFNDYGTADISTYIRLASPTLTADRIAFHEQFAGDMKSIKTSTGSYMVYCLKSTAPLMSSSENQSFRKAEFAQVVEGQLRNGKYKMREEKVVINVDPVTGEELIVTKNEIINDDDGNPVFKSLSPIISEFKMKIVQFEVKDTDYDPETRKQFSAKKDAFLATEIAKTNLKKETQERLMIIEKGLREVAEAEAAGNVAKETAVIAAKLKAEVAVQDKIAAETKASQLLSVAELDKKTLLMAESAVFEQAQIKAQTAEENKKAMISEAEGKKEAIELSGAITELEEAQIRASVDKAIGVAEALAKIPVPSTMIIGGSDGGGTSVMENLINLKLMADTGILDKTNVDTTSVDRKVKE